VRPIVACHQPNFFPWLGYFHKIRVADVFVFLDDVEIQKTRGSVTNRVAMCVAGRQEWVGASLDRRYSGNVQIREVAFSRDVPWREKVTATLRFHYGRTPFFRELGPKVLELVQNPEPMLAAYNMHAVTSIAGWLGLSPRFVRSSELEVTSTSTLRLVELTEKLEGRTYLAGSGAAAYQQDELFAERGIGVLYQAFTAPAYPRQGHDPMPGLSVLDALFHLGIDSTRALLDAEPGAPQAAP